MRPFPGYFKHIFLIIAASALAVITAGAPGVTTAGPGPEAPNGAGPFVVKPMAPVKDAPDFTSEALGGGKASLSDFRGKVIIVHFWASWCVPCREEFPALNALYGRLKEKGLVILAVAEDSHSRVDPFVKAHGAVFPVVVDRYGGVMKKYGIKVIPSSVIVDRSGKAAWIIIGPRDYGSPDAIEFFEKILE